MKKPAYMQSFLTSSPDFRPMGFHPATLLTGWAFFRLTPAGMYIDNETDMAIVTKHADLPWWDGREDQPVIFDIETLPTTTADRPRRDHVHDQLIEICQLYRNHPRHHYKSLGFYGLMPGRDFWRAIKDPSNGGQAGYERWQAENRLYLDSLHDGNLSQERGVATHVDRLYPSLYFWYNTPWHLAKFEQYVDANLQEAAIYNKPVIPFISPNVQQAGHPFWDKGTWGRMLSYVYNHPLTDGVYIWVIAGQQPDWNDAADWWAETKAVLGIT